MEDDDIPAPVPLPSFAEIGAAIAAALPFVVHAESSSGRWEDGRLVEYVYRDWVAVGGGIAAIVLALIGLSMVRRTARARRAARVIVCVALAGAGLFHALRGFGVVGAPEPPRPSAVDLRFDDVDVDTAQPVPAAAPALRPLTEQALASLDEVAIEKVHAEAHPGFQDAAPLPRAKQIFAQIGEILGRFEAIVTHEQRQEGEDWRSTGQARFANATVTYDVTYRIVDGRPRLTGLNVTPPPELLDRSPPVEDAAATARAALDGLLRGDLEPLRRSAAPDLEFAADLGERLAPVLDEIGELREVRLESQRSCVGQCIDFSIVGEKNRATASFKLGVDISRWQVESWNLTVEK